MKKIYFLIMLVSLFVFAANGSIAQEEGGAASSPTPLIEEPKLEEAVLKEEEISAAPEIKLQLTQKIIEESENRINNLEKEINNFKKWGIGVAASSIIALVLALYSLTRSKKSF